MALRRRFVAFGAFVTIAGLGVMVAGDGWDSVEIVEKEDTRQASVEDLKKSGLKPGTLPPLHLGTEYNAPPPPEGGYRLKLPGPTPGLERVIRHVIKRMWVHRVKGFVPGTTAEAGETFAAKLGLKDKNIRKVTGRPYFTSGPSRGFFYPEESSFSYYSGANAGFDRLTDDERRKVVKKAGMDQKGAEDFGKEWLKRHSILPTNLAPKNDGVGGALENGIRYNYDFRYHGQVEGWSCWGPGQELEYQVLANGDFWRFQFAWTEAERLGVVECKSVDEAIDALNKGYAGPVAKEYWGGSVVLLRTVYYAEGVGSTVIQPCYYFELRDKDGTGYAPYYVPMAKAKYFKDPKTQVVLVKKTR